MRIDWFTLIAQIVNFLVLIWLLKRFLYGRIIRAMNDREARIASRLEEAAHKRAEAEREAKEYHDKNEALQRQREQLLAQARADAESRGQELIDEARQSVRSMQSQWLDAIREEQRQLLDEVRERLGQQVFAIARRALADLAGVELEERVVVAFLDRLKSLDTAEREAIVKAIRTLDREVEFHTAFPLEAELRERVRNSLREQLDDSVDVRFSTISELTCGVELRAHSHRVVWNLDSYLGGLEESVFEAIDERASEHAKPEK